MKKETKVCTCRPYFPVRAKMTERLFGEWVDDNQAAAILAGDPMPPPDKELTELIGTVFCVIDGGEDVDLKRGKPYCNVCGRPVPIDPQKVAFPCMVTGSGHYFAELLRGMDVIPEDAHLWKFVEQAQAHDNIFPLN